QQQLEIGGGRGPERGERDIRHLRSAGVVVGYRLRVDRRFAQDVVVAEGRNRVEGRGIAVALLSVDAAFLVLDTGPCGQSGAWQQVETCIPQSELGNLKVALAAGEVKVVGLNLTDQGAQFRVAKVLLPVQLRPCHRCVCRHAVGGGDVRGLQWWYFALQRAGAQGAQQQS